MCIPLRGIFHRKHKTSINTTIKNPPSIAASISTWCLFPYLADLIIRMDTFDMYEWSHLRSFLGYNEQKLQPQYPRPHQQADYDQQYFILFSINKWMMILKHKHIQVLSRNGFFFNRCQNVIMCHHCGIIYKFFTTVIEHYDSCIFKTIDMSSNKCIEFIIIKGQNFIPLYPVYNRANWDDSFTRLRYGTRSLMNNTLEHWFTAHTSSFLTTPNTTILRSTSPTTSIARQLYFYETLRGYANFLCLKFNFYREACNNIDVFLKQSDHGIIPIKNLELFNNNNDILDSFNCRSGGGPFVGRIKLNCPLCTANATHILTCGHSFCYSCLIRLSKIKPKVCQFCFATIKYKPIKIIFY